MSISSGRWKSPSKEKDLPDHPRLWSGNWGRGWSHFVLDIVSGCLMEHEERNMSRNFAQTGSHRLKLHSSHINFDLPIDSLNYWFIASRSKSNWIDSLPLPRKKPKLRILLWDPCKGKWWWPTAFPAHLCYSPPQIPNFRCYGEVAV